VICELRWTGEAKPSAAALRRAEKFLLSIHVQKFCRFKQLPSTIYCQRPARSEVSLPLHLQSEWRLCETEYSDNPHWSLDELSPQAHFNWLKHNYQSLKEINLMSQLELIASLQKN